ncbi:MAG TPA: hypothetical protein PLM08_13540, partial [Polyangiaceae bacterium]|nr:hypothetical protein [Polyangiaceae bacterium]
MGSYDENLIWNEPRSCCIRSRPSYGVAVYELVSRERGIVIFCGVTSMAFTSLDELLLTAQQQQRPIYELMIESEIRQKGISREEIIIKMTEQFAVMEEAVREG